MLQIVFLHFNFYAFNQSDLHCIKGACVSFFFSTQISALAFAGNWSYGLDIDSAMLYSLSIWPQTSTSNPTQQLAGACQLTLSITCHARKEPWPTEWQDGALPIRTLKRRTSNNLGSKHNLGRATHHHILIEHVASLLLSCVQIAIVNSVQLSIYKWGSITQALAVAYVQERSLSLHALPDSWL